MKPGIVSSMTMNRREFVVTSGLATGGLAAGGLMLGLADRAEASASEGFSTFSPSAFVHIAPNGDTTLYCGRTEMGQGISTALPAAVADELEADWDKVTVLQGEASKEKFGPQGTGGSQSINIMFEPMRKAGAAGKELLVAAAAERWNLPTEDCYAQNHQVLNRRDDRTLGYGELAEPAAKIAHDKGVPEEPVLKTRDQFRYIGKALQRHDQGMVVMGQRIYGSDVKVPGMKYAAIRHVPVMGGKLKSLDKSQAEAMKGVVAVVEIPRFENAYGSLGGVAVVADNSWTAMEAAKKLVIDWDAGEHGSYNTDEFKKMMLANVEKPAKEAFNRGDVDAALNGAAVRHSASYLGGHLSHSPMEPMASAVSVKEDSCEVWASTQDPQGIQRTLGAYLGIDPGKVKVNVMISGGAFGRKFKCDYVQEAAACSRAVGAPVQLTWSREEDTRTGYYHSCSAQHIEASLDENGQVTGWLHRAAFPPIGATFDPNINQPTDGDLNAVKDHPYSIPNLRAESGHAPAHTRIGWYRAVYAIFYGFAINVFSDELARKAGQDTLAFLQSIYDRSMKGDKAEQARRSRAVLDTAAEMGGWGREMPENHGLGIAVHHSFESYVAMVVHAEVTNGNVRVHRVDCAVDCGLVLNPDIATAQMEGAVIMGIGLAMNTEVKFDKGAVVNSNFHDYLVPRMNEAPAEIKVRFIGQENTPTGLGEPGVPTLAPALANAIFAASGVRHRSLPINAS